MRKLAILNTYILYLDSNNSIEKLETRPASTAPAPKLTKSAGKAQQTKVPKLVNKLIRGRIIFLIVINLISIIFFYLSL